MATLQGFVTVGPQASLYTPIQPENGQLIVLCTWLGADHNHIAKYTTIYKQSAPHARILLVESAVPTLMSSYTHRRKNIKSAVSIVLEILGESNHETAVYDRLAFCRNHGTFVVNPFRAKKPRILLHAFSNGGIDTATRLLHTIGKRTLTSLPMVGLFCDGCPAEEILQRRSLLSAATLEPGWGCEDDGIKKDDGNSCVCFVYSEVDRTDVHGHANLARDLGWRVRGLVFGDGGHAAQLPGHENLYSQLIKEIWDGDACLNNNTASKL